MNEARLQYIRGRQTEGQLRALLPTGKEQIRRLAGQYVERLYRDFPDGLCGGAGGCEACLETHLVAFGVLVAQAVRRDEQGRQARRGR